MLKLTALVSLMLIGMLYAAQLSCDSCGEECASSCGSRRFRACCFNYLRKKRGQDTAEFWTSNDETQQKLQPAIFVQYLPEDLISNFLANMKNNPELDNPVAIL